MRVEAEFRSLRSAVYRQPWLTNVAFKNLRRTMCIANPRKSWLSLVVG